MEIEGKFFLPLRAIITGFFVGLLALAIGAYVLYQARFLTEGPVITLTTDIPSTTSTSTLIISGVAQNIVSLSLNGRTIYTTDEGVFEETLPLAVGYTVITIEGVDRYKKRERLERSVVYTPTTNE
jgi:hypothetical protein